MKYFLDTEFIEAGPSNPLVLLSVGIVSEDGREFYAVNDQANLINMSDWVRDNVMPHLGNFTMSLDAIRRGVRKFVNDIPEFWGYYADYDWVIFCQIFGSMIDLPKGWPMYCRDIKQLCDSAGSPKLPPQLSTEHNALHDAKWNKIAYEFLVERAIAESRGQTDELGFDEATETRWQNAIYEICKKAVGPKNDHLIDGGGCDSGDALDFTLSEIRQTFTFLEEKIPELGDGEPSSALLGVCNYGNHESPHPAWPACRNWKPLSESGAAQEVSPTEKEKRIERPKS